MANSNSSYSLYIHVPFCKGKCLYCDFYSVPVGSATDEIRRAVMTQTLLQAERFRRAFEPGAILQTIYVGGGTPSVLPQRELRELLQPFHEAKPSEWTVEANPESLDPEFLAACADAGVTRISLGIQCMEEKLLRSIGRPGSLNDTNEALELVRRGWGGDLNLDFIAGVPGQSTQGIREEMSILGSIRPAHVSLYSLTLEPETPLARLVGKGEIVPNSAAIDEELWFTGKQELESRGYSHYEISNFCAPGKECRHNLGYWRLEPYAGAGPAAVSTLPGAVAARILERPDLEGRQVVRLANPRDIDRFLAGWEARWGIEVDVVRAADFLIENLMMGFRLAEGVPSSRIERRFGRRFEELFPGMWKRWISAGFAFEGREVLRLSEHGRLMLDRLMKEIVAVAKGGTLPPLELNWP